MISNVYIFTFFVSDQDKKLINIYYSVIEKKLPEINLIV